MCGIVGAVTRRDVADILLEGLLRLEYRGYDSAGMAILEASGDVRRLRRVGKVAELVSAQREAQLEGNLGISHTRWATHGKPTEDNAHPHYSSDKVAVVHNGIVENYQEIREELLAAGYQFESETDTETIAHLVHSEVEKAGDFREGVTRALARLEGAYAVGIMHGDYPDRLIGARIGSPLVVGLGIGENYIASDPQALRPVTDRFIFLEEGEIVELTTREVSIYGMNNQSVESRAVRLDDHSASAEKGNFRHYMQKEIFEQPEAIAATLDERISRRRLLDAAFGVGSLDVFKQTQAVQIVACGSAFYTGMVARYWIERLTGIPCQAEIASEYRYRDVAVLPNTLLVTISQSGETADTLAALRDATEENYLASLTLCNVANSTLVRESDFALLTHAGPEIGVASTKAFVTQLVDLLLLVIALGKAKGTIDAALEEELVQALHDLPSLIEEVLQLDGLIKREMALKFVNKDHALFLARGSHYPIALEGALKLKEISYVHAEGYPAGELKHGPLALVDDEMPVIAVAPNDELLDKLKSNLQEVRARGGELYVFADKASEVPPEPGCTIMHLPSVHRVLSPILYAIPMQLLAYHVAVLRGTDVDQPRNLAKSVTVE